MQPYHEMTTAQARAYLEQFMSEMDAGRERLADTLRERGADPVLAHDLTPGSLHLIWEAVSPLLAWQDGYTPPDSMLPWIQSSLEGLGDLDALPSWVATVGGPIDFSPDTLWIIDGVGRHLGNVMVASVPGMRWDVGHHRIRAYVHRNKPVVIDPEGADLNPLEVAAIVTARSLDGLLDSGSNSPWDSFVMRAAYSRPTTTSGAPTEATALAPSGCGCGEHIDEVAGLAVPFAASGVAGEHSDTPVTVADLVEWERWQSRRLRTSRAAGCCGSATRPASTTTTTHP